MPLSRLTSPAITTGAIATNLGFTPANAATALTSVNNGNVNSYGISNVNVSGANTWTTVNSSRYKWDIPSAGRYFMYTNVRARIWGYNAFLKGRLYDATNSYSDNTLEKMIIEFQTNASTLNVQTTLIWTLDIASARTYYFQISATSSGEIGIQSDSNGWNETGWIKLS